MTSGAGAGRAMQPLNRLYWYYERLLRRAGSNANSCEWLELLAEPDLSALAEATRLVARRHPVLRSRIETSPWRPPVWIEDAPIEPEIRVERIGGPAPADAVDRLSGNVWQTPLDLTAGPPWRLHLTVYEDKTFLQVVTTHIYTDGKSANRAVCDLVRAYAAVVGGGAFDCTPVEPSTRDFGRLYLAGRTAAERRGLYVAALRGIVREALQPVVNLPARKTGHGRTRVALLDLGPDLWQALRDTARSEGVSRHPFYVGAMSEAVAAYNARHGGRTEGRLKLIDNFSIRDFAPEDISELYDLCAVPYALDVPVTARTDAGFRAEAMRKIAALKSGDILAEIARYRLYMASAALSPKLLSTKLVLATIVKSNVFLSNIGPVPSDIHADRALGIRDYYSFSQLFPPGKLMIFLSSTETTLRAVCLWNDAAFRAEDVTGEILPAFTVALEGKVRAPIGPSLEQRIGS